MTNSSSSSNNSSGIATHRATAAAGTLCLHAFRIGKYTSLSIYTSIGYLLLVRSYWYKYTGIPFKFRDPITYKIKSVPSVAGRRQSHTSIKCMYFYRISCASAIFKMEAMLSVHSWYPALYFFCQTHSIAHYSVSFLISVDSDSSLDCLCQQYFLSWGRTLCKTRSWSYIPRGLAISTYDTLI